MFGQRLLLLIALLASLVVLGVWDNQHQMERVLEQGYDAPGRITDAQFQRKAPFAVDGWRPRFVEQDLSVDVQWSGRDGKEHTHKKVPVSESFARTIVSGDQVRLAALALKALDDEQSVPVILSDASQRLASLKSWMTISGYAALAAWAAFAAVTLVMKRARQQRGAGISKPLEIPPRRTILGLALLLIGGYLAFQSWSASEAADAARHEGTAVSAEILAIAGGAGSHTIQLAWKGDDGAVHHFGPVPISDAFYGQIAKDGQLAVRQTELRIHDDDLTKRPVVVADVPYGGWLGRIGLGAGVAFLVIGLGCLGSAARYIATRR